MAHVFVVSILHHLKTEGGCDVVEVHIATLFRKVDMKKNAYFSVNQQ